MIKELDLFGIFMPPMFAYAAVAGLVWLLLRSGLSAAGFYRFVWHPALFNTALYVLILAGLVTVFFQ